MHRLKFDFVRRQFTVISVHACVEAYKCSLRWESLCQRSTSIHRERIRLWTVYSYYFDRHSSLWPDCRTDEIDRQALDRWRTASSCRLILSIAKSSMFYISWDLALNEDWFLFLSFLLLPFLISRSPLTFLPLVFRRIWFYLLLRRDYKRQQSQSDYSQIKHHRIPSCFSPLLSFQK